MDILKLNENICRICLENNIILNWSDEICVSYGVSYKDCYYKYTHLRDSDSDSYPTNLCKNCANGLKNAHMLFEKALESFNILQVAFADSKYILPDEKTIKIDDEILLSPMYSSEGIPKTENNTEEISIEENMKMEPAHFVDITNLGSFPENSLEQQLVEISDNEYTNNKSTNKGNKSERLLKSSLKRRKVTKKAGNKCKSITKTSCEKLGISSDCQLPNASATKKGNKPNKLCDQLLLDNVESCGANPSVSKLTQHKKRKVKMCQYCSLQLDESRLKKHEATHNENRERKEICPQCGVKLYDKLALNVHIKIHRENRQKDHKCEFCEKAFFNKGSLNVHKRIHLGLMIKCQICSKEYFRQVDLNKHLLTHSAAPPQKKGQKVKYTIQCQFCNKNILTTSWKEHKSAHLNQPQTKCKICDKDFFSRASFTHHLKKVHRTREFDKFIYYHVDRNSNRMSHLMMEQQEKVQSLSPNSH